MMIRKLRPLGFLTILLVMAGILFVESQAGEHAVIQLSASNKVNVDPNAVYTASATIMGLAVFGSVFAVRPKAQPSTVYRMWRFAIITLLMIIVGIQTVTMHLACCTELDPSKLTTYLFATFVCLIVILIIFITLDEVLRHRGA